MKTWKNTQILVSNDTHRLVRDDFRCNGYVVFTKCPGFWQEVARSWYLTKKIKKFFSDDEIKTALEEIKKMKKEAA